MTGTVTLPPLTPSVHAIWDTLLDLAQHVPATSPWTLTPPGRTLSVPGGTQALARTERVRVIHGPRTGLVPRPSLLGANVGKGRACGLPGDTSRHHRDLALLCALVEDPFEMRERMSRTDPAALRRGWALGQVTHPAWALVPAERRAAGHITLRVLCT